MVLGGSRGIGAQQHREAFENLQDTMNCSITTDVKRNPSFLQELIRANLGKLYDNNHYIQCKSHMDSNSNLVYVCIQIHFVHLCVCVSLCARVFFIFFFFPLFSSIDQQQNTPTKPESRSISLSDNSQASELSLWGNRICYPWFISELTVSSKTYKKP